MQAARSRAALESFSWTFPGAPVHIRFAFSAMDELRREVLDWDGRETGGILLGYSLPGRPLIICITGYQPFLPHGPRREFAGEERRTFADTLSRLGDIGAVGYYRSRLAGSDLSLDEADLDLIRSWLHQPEHVFLVMRPDADGEVAAGFFFWDDGQINSEFSYLEFPLDPDQLREEGVIATPDDSRRGGRRFLWGSVAAGGLIAAGLVAMLMVGPVPPPHPGVRPPPIAIRPGSQESGRTARAPAPAPARVNRPADLKQFAAPAATPARAALAFLEPPTLHSSRRLGSAPPAALLAGLPPPRAESPVPLAQADLYVPPKPVRRVQPVLPADVRSVISRETRVQVKLSIDREGRIVAAEPVGAGEAPSNVLATIAASTARLWRFEPARRNSRPVPSEIVVDFSFLAPPQP